MEFNKNQPIYSQITEYICEKIILQVWKEGERILSVRELAAAIQVNPNTAMRAYSSLQEMEILTNQRGIGFFVAEKGLERAKQYIAGQVINYDMQYLFRKMNYLNMSSDELVRQYNIFIEKSGGIRK